MGERKDLEWEKNSVKDYTTPLWRTRKGINQDGATS